MPRQITAFSNPLVKQARGLRDKKNRRAEGLFLAEGLRILTEAREAGVLPERLFFSDASHPLARRADRRDRGRRRRGDRDQCRHPPQDFAARTIRRPCSASTARSTPASPAIDRAAAPLWIVAQALRDPGNLGTILQDRRRGRRRRADPDRRLRRPLLGRGGARVDGRPVHPEDRGGALGGVRALAALGAGPADRHQPQRRRRTIRRRATRSPPSSWSATSRPGCRPPMRPNATCWSRCRCWARPTASTRRWRRR